MLAAGAAAIAAVPFALAKAENPTVASPQPYEINGMIVDSLFVDGIEIPRGCYRFFPKKNSAQFFRT